MNKENTVVHCTTQEQWDFVTEKLGYKWDKGTIWSIYRENTAINLERIGYSKVTFYKDIKKIILSFENWCKENNYTYTKVYTKDDFVVGKWYKFLNTTSNTEWIIKITHFDNGIRGWTKCIPDNYSDLKGYHQFEQVSNLKELSIEEVQQYLPIDHPDYIKDIQMIKGEIYRVEDKGTGSNWWAIGKALEGVNTKSSDSEFLRNKATYIYSSKELAKDSMWCYASTNKERTFRLATKEEREWLEYCISQGMYVDQNEVPKKLYKDQLLEEAKKRYPIGTKFKSALTKGGIYMSDGNIYWDDYKDILFSKKMAIYYKDTWAEIIEEVKEVPKDIFLKDEYIVITKDMTSRYAIKNYIYKMRYDNKNIAPYLDSGDSTNNVFGIIYKDSNNWRYAIKEEIAEYDRLGKPYDVTTLHKIPEYVELLENFDNSHTGEIFKTSDNIAKYKNWDHFKDWSHLWNMHKTYFKPSTKEAYNAQQNKMNTTEEFKSQYWIRNNQYLNKYERPINKGDKKDHNLLGFIDLKDNTPHSFRSSGYTSNNSNLTEPTQQQVDWLEHCIKINKYISFEEFQKFSSTPSIDFKVGDWVKLIDISDKSYRKVASINIINNQILYSELISNSVYRKRDYQDNCDNLSRMKRVSLDEIEQYLPKEESKWIPKIGDWIVITKSDKNWGKGAMDKYVGKCVQITKVLDDKRYHIRFDNDGGWSWMYEDGHFRQAQPHEIPIPYIDVDALHKSVTMGNILEELSSKVVLMDITLPSSKSIELNLPKEQVELKPLLNIKLEQIKTINF